MQVARCTGRGHGQGKVFKEKLQRDLISHRDVGERSDCLVDHFIRQIVAIVS